MAKHFKVFQHASCGHPSKAQFNSYALSTERVGDAIGLPVETNFKVIFERSIVAARTFELLMPILEYHVPEYV